jgi:hypothetical protein
LNILDAAELQHCALRAPEERCAYREVQEQGLKEFPNIGGLPLEPTLELWDYELVLVHSLHDFRQPKLGHKRYRLYTLAARAAPTTTWSFVWQWLQGKSMDGMLQLLPPSPARGGEKAEFRWIGDYPWKTTTPRISPT